MQAQGVYLSTPPVVACCRRCRLALVAMLAWRPFMCQVRWTAPCPVAPRPPASRPRRRRRRHCSHPQSQQHRSTQRGPCPGRSSPRVVVRWRSWGGGLCGSRTIFHFICFTPIFYSSSLSLSPSLPHYTHLLLIALTHTRAALSQRPVVRPPRKPSGLGLWGQGRLHPPLLLPCSQLRSAGLGHELWRRGGQDSEEQLVPSAARCSRSCCSCS